MTVERTRLAFTGAREATAPATWGQSTTWRDIQFFLPEPQWWFILKRQVAVPAGLGLGAVLDAVAEILARHEATRTLLVLEGSRLVQRAVARGVLTVDLVESTADRLDADLEAYKLGDMSRPIDHDAELPLRVAVGVCDGAPKAVLLGISHVVADVGSVNLLAAEFGVLLAAAAAGVPAPPAKPCLQPVDVARAEQGEAGRAWTAAALEHLADQLNRIPSSMFGAPAPAPAPRYRAATLSSDLLAPAVHAAADRFRVSTSAVLFAATAALLHAQTGTPEVTFALLSANRADRLLRQAVGNLSQSAPATVTVGGGSFGDLAVAAGDAALSAHRRARYDPAARDDLIARIQADRGIEFDLGCRFNDMWSARTGRVPAGAARPDGRFPAPTSTLVWDEGSDTDKLSFFVEVFGPPGRIGIKAIADTARFPAPQIPRLLRGIESALLALEANERMSVAEFAGAMAESDTPHEAVTA